MSFMYPLGLLGLIGIPVLILIYIIKNKYTEQVVSSTYLWNLSEKFLKKRLPINKLVGIISLILQILAVLFISVAVSRPVFIIPDSANDYCFVLDCSGSMNMQENGRTRLEAAKSEIAEVIDESKKGSIYTLVAVGDSTEVVFEAVDSKERALLLLNGIEQAYTSNAFTDAVGVAQRYFNNNPSVKTYLFTDKTFEENRNVQVINVAKPQDNYAVSSVGYAFGADGRLTVHGKVTSYESAAELTVKLHVVYDVSDGISGTAEYSQKVEVQKLEAVDFTFVCEQTGFRYVEASVSESDALALDNKVTVFNIEYENSYTALLVSDSPFYIYAALLSSGNARVEVISTEKFNADYSGYDLYIFDSYSPEALPRDGAVWFFNPQTSVAESGFTVQDEVELAAGRELDYTSSSSTFAKTLMRDIVKDKVYVAKYKKCGLYRNFTTVLSCDGNPMVFTGTNAYGNREVVFAFDLHFSNFPLLADYATLSGNLLGYTFPTVIENASYYCGETLLINVTANCDSIRVDSPLNKIVYLDTSAAVCEFTLNEVGAYKITMISGETERVFNVYSSLPEEERVPASKASAFSLQGDAGNKKLNGIYDDLLPFFIMLALLFAADWMVYCYEQYQLR